MALMSAPSVGTKLVLVILLQGRLLGVTRTKAARTLSWINFRRDEPYRHLGLPRHSRASRGKAAERMAQVQLLSMLMKTHETARMNPHDA